MHDCALVRAARVKARMYAGPEAEITVAWRQRVRNWAQCVRLYRPADSGLFSEARYLLQAPVLRPPTHLLLFT